MNSHAFHVKSSIMIVVVIRKAWSTFHNYIRLVLSLLILVYYIFIGSSSTAKDRHRTSQREWS